MRIRWDLIIVFLVVGAAFLVAFGVSELRRRRK